MADLGELLDAMVVQATSPDNNIKARLSHRRHIDLAFRPGAYDGYVHDVLEHQLSRLATLCWTGYQRADAAAVAKVMEENGSYGAKEAAWDPNRRRFDADWAATTFEGTGPGGFVKMRNTGMTNWRVRIKPGALDRVYEDEFIVETQGAIQALLRDYRLKVALLKDEHYERPFEPPPPVAKPY